MRSLRPFINRIPSLIPRHNSQNLSLLKPTSHPQDPAVREIPRTPRGPEYVQSLTASGPRDLIFILASWSSLIAFYQTVNGG